VTQSGSEMIAVIGAGAAGLMAARELAAAGRRVTILEARDRCGGRIWPLPASDFGYAAEGGAEFIHGEAPLTHALLREARLSPQTIKGQRWTVEGGMLSRRTPEEAYASEFQTALQTLTQDMSVAEFLKRHFSGGQYDRLRQSIERTVQGYDAADPSRASILALREEWMGTGRSTQARIAGGYGALIDFLAAECRTRGVVVQLGAVVSAIETAAGKVVVRCADGSSLDCGAAIVTVPVAVMKDIAFPPAQGEKIRAAAEIGFGNVIKLLLRFETRWWLDRRSELAELTFLLSEKTIPVWWTQQSAETPVLTGWFGGPRTATLSDLGEQDLIEAGLVSLADIFGVPLAQLKTQLGAARAINWAHDPFARGAYSWATTATREAQSLLARDDGSSIVFCGEALYRGPDMGTVEAALANGRDTAQAILRKTHS
jgi:monoamine oxidase